MLKIICMLLVFAGSCTMLASIIVFKNTLRAYLPTRKSALDHYTAILIMMIFFLLGYLITIFYIFSLSVIDMSMVLIAIIFFFGAIFCYSVVSVQSDLLDRLKQNTNELQVAFKEAKTANINLEGLNQELTSTMEALKYAQSQLVFSEKMSALGKLMAGISHEINTPIGAVRASAESLQTLLDGQFQQLLKDLRQLADEDFRDYIQYTETAIANTRQYTSTSEVRKLKRQARQVLEGAEGFNEATLELLARNCLLDDETLNLVLAKQGSERFVNVLRLTSKTVPMVTFVDNIVLSTDKVIKMVTSLKSFSHFSANSEKTAFNLISGIETVLAIYVNQLKYDVEVVTDFEQVPEISGYEDELCQVWSNLIQNSIYAMREGSGVPVEERQPCKLVISVKNRDDEHVVVSIADNGGGISPEKMENIFEPFYTTKPTGIGSGLGLSITKQIIDKHNGVIAVESHEGVGTTFTITLPR